MSIQHKNGAYKCDEYLNYYSMARRSIKWWKSIF